ncbi:unnamed protein product [Caenorhabditis bovis]|uniref:Uncharacterized protein n=1 Tax=Caenorhabditis bovis TaxID=2654633 RepID=A0A8S1F0F2_9PELO|nr:unnamed protein product [Caenorhabditis bovis]
METIGAAWFHQKLEIERVGDSERPRRIEPANSIIRCSKMADNQVVNIPRILYSFDAYLLPLIVLHGKLFKFLVIKTIGTIVIDFVIVKLLPRNVRAHAAFFCRVAYYSLFQLIIVDGMSFAMWLILLIDLMRSFSRLLN